MGNHTNFKGMFNKERIENLEKRVKELERIQGISKLSEAVSKRLIHALIDSNNEVVKRVFDDVCVRSISGTSVFQPPKAGDIHASNAVFNGIPDSLKKVEEDKAEAPTIASVLEKARRNTIAIQELLKRTGCSSVNEVISKFELGVSFKKMYDEEARKRKELAIQRDRLERDLRNQIAKNKSLIESEKNLICKLADKEVELKRVEELSDGRYKEVVWLRGELKDKEKEIEKLKDENKQLKSVNADRVTRTLNSICGESDAVVRYLDLKKRYEDLEKKKETLLGSERELQKQVFDLSRDKKYLEIANASLLQETRKTKDVLNEKIKKLRQRLKKSSIRYRDLKEIISHNGLKSV